MRLSALDIKKKEFQQKMRGADPDEVQAFLNEVSQEVETLAKEKSELETRVQATNEKLDRYLGLESTLEKTLVAAQQTALKIEEQAKREAELILRDAELEKTRRLTDARVEQERLERDLLRMKSEFESTLARMKSIVASFNAFVGSFESESKPVVQNPMPTASPMLPTPLPDGQVQWASTGTTPEPPPL